MRTLVAALSAVAVLAGGVTAADAATVPAVSTAPGAYVAVAPHRLVNLRTVSGSATTSIKVTGADGVPSTGVAAVAVTISVLSPAASGAVVAWAAGATRPPTANVQFTKGQRASDLALVAPNSSGSISIFNRSTASLQLSVDLTGYYLAGASSDVKSFHQVKATRVVDHSVGANSSYSPVLGGSGPLPGSQIGAVAVTISEAGSAHSGYLTAGAYQLPITPATVLRWTANQRAGAFAIVPVNADGQLTLTNHSSGATTFTVDVVGYFLEGAPSVAGMLNTLPAARIVNTTSVGSATARSFQITGRGGVAKTGVRAAVLIVTAETPAASGALVVYPGGTRPGTANVGFASGHAASNVVLAPLSSSGTVSIYNNAARAVNVHVDVVGWVLAATETAPATSTGRYVRNLAAGDPSGQNEQTMDAEGCTDAQSHSTLILLELGVQSKSDRLAGIGGVLLTQTSIRLTYGELVHAISAYLSGFAGCRTDGQTARLALGTNSDGVYSGANDYPATDRGPDWYTKLIAPVLAAEPTSATGVTVIAAQDIEAGFTGTLTQVKNWESSYFMTTGTPLLFNGSLDGCPTSFTSSNATCDRVWTLADYYGLAHHGSQVQVLPEAYNSRVPIQWTDVDAVGHGGLSFAGSVTEYGAGDSYPPEQGWSALRNALLSFTQTPSLSAAVDLHVDG